MDTEELGRQSDALSSRIDEIQAAYMAASDPAEEATLLASRQALEAEREAINATINEATKVRLGWTNPKTSPPEDRDWSYGGETFQRY